MSAPSIKTVLADLWRLAGQPADALEAVALTGAEPALPSSFAVGTAAQTTIAASALAAAELWRLRTGRQQQRQRRRCATPAIEFRSERYLRIDGKPLARASGQDRRASTAAATAAGCGCTPTCRITAPAR